MTTIDREYQSIEKLVHHTVHLFRRRFAGDQEELTAEANLLAVKAIRSHDASKSKLGTWVRNRIWWGLQEQRRNRLTTSRNMPTVCVDPNTQPERVKGNLFALREFAAELGRDAEILARLAIEGDGPDNGLRRGWIVSFLIGLGWSAERIAETFTVVRRAL